MSACPTVDDLTFVKKSHDLRTTGTRIKVDAWEALVAFSHNGTALLVRTFDIPDDYKYSGPETNLTRDPNNIANSRFMYVFLSSVAVNQSSLLTFAKDLRRNFNSAFFTGDGPRYPDDAFCINSALRYLYNLHPDDVAKPAAADEYWSSLSELPIAGSAQPTCRFSNECFIASGRSNVIRPPAIIWTLKQRHATSLETLEPK